MFTDPDTASPQMAVWFQPVSPCTRCPSQSCPQGWNRVAVRHTHGKHRNPRFSGKGTPSPEVWYVADHRGDITKYDLTLPGNRSQQQKYICRGCAK
jgi:hypothetical protein